MSELAISIRVGPCPGCDGAIVGRWCTKCGWDTDSPHNVNVILSWTSRMARAYGGTVYERSNGKAWDWGQAICREQYGPNWSSLGLDSPTGEDVERALEWELGDWPKWAVDPREESDDA